MSRFTEARALFSTHGDVAHGYDTHALTKLARRAVACRKARGLPEDVVLGELAEVALAGIVDALCAAPEPPREKTLLDAGANSVRNHVRQVWLYDRGFTAHGTPSKGFHRYWGEHLTDSGRMTPKHDSYSKGLKA